MHDRLLQYLARSAALAQIGVFLVFLAQTTGQHKCREAAWQLHVLVQGTRSNNPQHTCNTWGCSARGIRRTEHIVTCVILSIFCTFARGEQCSGRWEAVFETILGALPPSCL